MDVWVVAGETVFILLFLFFSWFTIVSLFEKETKAVVRSALFLIFLVLLNFLFFLVPPFLKSYLFASMLAFFSCFFLWLFILPSPKKGIAIVGRQNKIDERDVIFARFDHQEGSPVFKDYYTSHPEFESVDDEIRQLPDLFSSSHNKKDPKLFTLAAAEFDFLEHLLTEVNGKTKPKCVSLSEEKNTQFIKQVIAYLGSDHCGIAALNQSYVYSHTGRGPDVYGKKIVLDHRYAVVFAVEMDLAMVAAAPKAPVVVETGKQYVEAAKISIIMANFIRRMGYSARAHIAGSNYQTVLPPLGWEAGLGELGRIGTLITSKYGPRARLGLVTTSLPLKPDKPKIIGIQNFCEKCQKCAVNCPAQAIPHGKKEEENGVLKWVLNREECYRYWRKAGTDCAMCMYVCPYSKPANLFHNFIRTAVAKSSLAQTLSVWGDDFFYGRNPKRKKSPFSSFF
jgi:ferredoxin